MQHEVFAKLVELTATINVEVSYTQFRQLSAIRQTLEIFGIGEARGGKDDEAEEEEEEDMMGQGRVGGKRVHN